MSINFQHPIDPEVMEQMKETFGEATAHDEQTFLYDKLPVLERKKMSDLARKSKQVVDVELNEVGDIKTLRDGTKYRVTERGWRRIPYDDPIYGLDEAEGE